MSVLYPDLPRTSFPNNLDSFVNYLNISVSDGPLIKQYFGAVQAGNEVLAQQIFAQIPSASQKILSADGLNKFNDCIAAIERFYNSDITPYLEQKQTEWESILDNFTYKGYYSNITPYVQNNYVTYVVSGVNNVYIALSDPPVGTAPTNTMYWRVLTVRGPAGISGVGVSFRGSWNSIDTYSLQDCVEYNGILWGCIRTNINQTPFEGSEYWELIASGNTTVYPVSEETPPIQEDGALWFKILPSTTNNINLNSLSSW